jgi:hypothetical protein
MKQFRSEGPGDGELPASAGEGWMAYGPADGPLDCGAVVERLPLHVGGDLEGAEEQAVDAHLAGCADCGQRFEQARRLRQIYFEAANRVTTGPLDLWPALRSALVAEGRLPAAPRGRGTRAGTTPGTTASEPGGRPEMGVAASGGALLHPSAPVGGGFAHGLDGAALGARRAAGSAPQTAGTGASARSAWRWSLGAGAALAAAGLALLGSPWWGGEAVPSEGGAPLTAQLPALAEGDGQPALLVPVAGQGSLLADGGAAAEEAGLRSIGSEERMVTQDGYWILAPAVRQNSGPESLASYR